MLTQVPSEITASICDWCSASGTACVYGSVRATSGQNMYSKKCVVGQGVQRKTHVSTRFFSVPKTGHRGQRYLHGDPQGSSETFCVLQRQQDQPYQKM